MRLSLRPMLTAVLLTFLPCPALADDLITGISSIVDADTLDIAGTRVRLTGVDAIEGDQRCTRCGEPWDCSADSIKALGAKISRREVTCMPSGKDRYGRALAICTAKGDKISLNEWLVCEWWAVAFRRYSKQFVPCEDQARKAKLGIWASEFIMPEQWRRQMRGDVAGGLIKQGWLSVIGLGLDIVGFLMIALEWWRGFREEHRERISTAEKVGKLISFDDMDPKPAESAALLKLTRYEMAARQRRFWFGAVLVIIGFVGQLLGSVPGGIPWLGIVP